MNESEQILFMQIRLLRMTAAKFSLTLKHAAQLFGKYDVLQFIRNGFGIFHVESDAAVFEEIKDFLKSKGVAICNN